MKHISVAVVVEVTDQATGEAIVEDVAEILSKHYGWVTVQRDQRTVVHSKDFDLMNRSVL